MQSKEYRIWMQRSNKTQGLLILWTEQHRLRPLPTSPSPEIDQFKSWYYSKDKYTHGDISGDQTNRRIKWILTNFFFNFIFLLVCFGTSDLPENTPPKWCYTYFTWIPAQWWRLKWKWHYKRKFNYRQLNLQSIYIHSAQRQVKSRFFFSFFISLPFSLLFFFHPSLSIYLRNYNSFFQINLFLNQEYWLLSKRLKNLAVV